MGQVQVNLSLSLWRYSQQGKSRVTTKSQAMQIQAGYDGNYTQRKLNTATSKGHYQRAICDICWVNSNKLFVPHFVCWDLVTLSGSVSKEMKIAHPQTRVTYYNSMVPGRGNSRCMCTETCTADAICTQMSKANTAISTWSGIADVAIYTCIYIPGHPKKLKWW